VKRGGGGGHGDHGRLLQHPDLGLTEHHLGAHLEVGMGWFEGVRLLRMRIRLR
jgi:hypothetical protein